MTNIKKNLMNKTIARNRMKIAFIQSNTYLITVIKTKKVLILKTLKMSLTLNKSKCRFK